MLTWPDGKFRFEGVANSYAQVTAQKPGYFPPEQINHMGSRTLVLSADKEDAPITVKLVPEGVIYGRIDGDSGEPVENIPVQLIWERFENGKNVRDANRTATIDEQGEFRLAELQPGRYFVYVGPGFWPVSFPAKLSQGGARGYSGVFYPGVPDMDSATAIEISPGKHVEINLTLASQPFYRISGRISGYSADIGGNVQILAPSGQTLGAGVDLNPATGTFRSSWFPGGACRIVAEAQDPKTNQQYFASQNLNVTSDLTGIHLALVPAGMIAVTTRVEATQSDTRYSAGSPVGFATFGPRMGNQPYEFAHVTLKAHGSSFTGQQQYSESTTPENAVPVIRNVPPGLYSVEVNANGPFYVASARAGSVNLLEENLTVGPGGSNEAIEIVVRDDFASVEGNLVFDAEADRVTILVFPAKGEQGRQAMTMMGGARSYQLSRLAPGEYKLLAVSNPEELDESNLEVRHKYMSMARAVSLAPGQKAKVELHVNRVGE
jgi:hypothetical protein